MATIMSVDTDKMKSTSVNSVIQEELWVIDIYIFKFCIEVLICQVKCTKTECFAVSRRIESKHQRSKSTVWFVSYWSDKNQKR